VEEAIERHASSGVISSNVAGRAIAWRTYEELLALRNQYRAEYHAEQVKAGIQSLPKGQTLAAMALGLTTTQSYRFVILPMALRIVLPPLTSESMNIIKNSSVAFAVSVSELTLFAMQAQEETSKGIEIYLAVTIMYMITALAMNRLMAWVEKKTRVPGFIAPNNPAGAH